MISLKNGVLRAGYFLGKSVGCLIVLSLFFGGCSARVGTIEQAFGESAASPEILETGGMRLMSVRVGTGAVQRIYIEGDGRAYISRGVVSGDPTPVTPVGLKLALQDGDGGLYLARPCQWVRGDYCTDKALWTVGRFTPEMVDLYVRLVASAAQGRPVELVGYSGGAWLALQVAARLENVTRVVTVAGNLMPEWVNAQHKVTRIAVAGYPVESRLQDLPIVAYVGTRDRIVSEGVVAAFKAATGAKNVRIVRVDAGHEDIGGKLGGGLK